ncbi:MAG: hypothetical protein J7M21_00420 [Planctomycetes bacterium]|nr:hypothetical protein [Planctomycetota bacterium]
MMRCAVWVIGVLAAAGAAVGVTAGRSRGLIDPPAADVRVVGLEVIRPLPGDKMKQSLTGRRTGTTLLVSVSRSGADFLGVDGKDCELDAFGDDRGTKLIDDAEAMLKLWAEGRNWVSPDGQRCIFEIISTKLPSPLARSVTFRGRIVMECGQGPAVAEQKNFRLVQGGKLKAGPAEMEVNGVQHGERETILSLATRADTRRIARLRFFQPGGGQLDARLTGKADVGFMGNTWHEWTYHIHTKGKNPKPVRVVDVRVEYFRKVRRVTVPVDVTAGVGL